MKQFMTMLVLFSAFMPSTLDAGALEQARKYEKIYLSVAVRVETFPTRKIGSGFLSKIEGDDTKVMFTTNKHLVDRANELQLTVPTKDASDAITGTLTFKVPFSKDSLNQNYIPEGNLDLALIIIDKAVMTAPGRESDLLLFSTLPFYFYADMKNLFAGQTVSFSGYPLDLSVNRSKPLLRNGSIAGIDTVEGVIYIDADAFGGSSGSPVFIDLSSQANLEFLGTYKQMLVGMISRYVPFKKQLLNLQTGQIEMIQTENSGIAVVIPADTIRRHAESFLAKRR